MIASPTLAAAASASFPSTGTASHVSSAGAIEFHNVLRQIISESGGATVAARVADTSTAESDPLSNTPADTAPADEKTSFLRSLSTISGHSTSVLTEPVVDNQQTAIADVTPASSTCKQKASAKTVSAKDNTKNAGAKKSSTAESTSPNATANGLVVPSVGAPVVAVPQTDSTAASCIPTSSRGFNQLAGAAASDAVVPTVASISTTVAALSTPETLTPLLRQISPTADAAASSVQSVAATPVSGIIIPSIPATLSNVPADAPKSDATPSGATSASATVADLPAAVPLESPSVVTPAAVSAVMNAVATESTTHAANASTVPMSAARPRAKTQSAAAIGKTSQASAPPNLAAAVSRTSQNFADTHTVVIRETFTNSNSPVAHSALHNGSDSSSSQPTPHVKTQAASQDEQSSAAPEKTATTPSNSSVSLASAVNAHSSGAEPLTVQPVNVIAALTDPAQSMAPSSTQSAAQSAALAQTSSSPAASANHAQSQVQSNPMPDPPRMVDSGQLRITPNSSELRVSVQLPDLGKLEVRAVTTHDVTTAHVTTFRHDALPVLAAGLAGLEQTLKARDVILGSLDSRAQGQSAGQQHQQNSQPYAQSSRGTPLIATTTTSATVEASTAGFLPDYSSISVRA
jgi:hypothetical protein